MFTRGIQHQTVQELEKQVELLRDRDGQLQYTVKEQEAKIEALKHKLRNTGDKVCHIIASIFQLRVVRRPQDDKRSVLV